MVFGPKPGKTSYHDAKSFWPISFTCFLLKALEIVIELEIKSKIIPNNSLNSRQQAYTADKFNWLSP